MEPPSTTREAPLFQFVEPPVTVAERKASLAYGTPAETALLKRLLEIIDTQKADYIRRGWATQLEADEAYDTLVTETNARLAHLAGRPQ